MLYKSKQLTVNVKFGVKMVVVVIKTAVNVLLVLVVLFAKYVSFHLIYNVIKLFGFFKYFFNAL
jgi:hypothetical protein